MPKKKPPNLLVYADGVINLYFWFSAASFRPKYGETSKFCTDSEQQLFTKRTS